MRDRVFLAAILIAGAGFSHAQLIPGNLKIRVEKADRINPPAAGTSINCYRGKDNYFNEIEISAGTFYGYTANGYKTTNGSSTDYSTCAITGNKVYNMGASLDNTGVIASGLANNQNTAFSSCGYWLNGTYKSGSTYYGFAHAEGYATTEFGRTCDYGQGSSTSTTKSMGLLTSTDGKHWTAQGQIIANPFAQSGGTTNIEYGEGDCTPIPFGTYLYLYCRSTKHDKTTIARAPLTSNFGQASWQKLIAAGTWGGSWNSDDYEDGVYGNSASIFANYGNVTLLRSEFSKQYSSPLHGVQISFSNNSDATAFTTIPQPLIPMDDYQYPNATNTGDLVAYPSALSGTDGSRIWNSYFIMAYTFVPNSAGVSSAADHGRIIAMRNVSVSQQSSPQTPQVAIALSRWYNSNINQRISTMEPVPYNFAQTSYSLEKPNTGYLLTAPPASGSKTLVECESTASWPSATNPDHILSAFDSSTTPSNNGCDANYVFLRTAGYLYSSSQGSSTVPVYRCKPGTGNNGSTATHFASNSSDCDGYGIEEYTLGYALAN
jgi:hypothetical protein